MTLGNWMKNYLYIPLGGNKVDSKKRLYFNLWLVFLLSGFWHGAAWTFVFWGIYHGILLILERTFLLNFYKKTGKVIPVLITFLLVSFGWVFFRADSFKYGAKFILKLFSFDFKAGNIITDPEFIFFFVLAFVFSFFTLFNAGKKIQDNIYYGKYRTSGYTLGTVLSIVFFIVCLAAITSSTFNPFIYFRF